MAKKKQPRKCMYGRKIKRAEAEITEMGFRQISFKNLIKGRIGHIGQIQWQKLLFGSKILYVSSNSFTS